MFDLSITINSKLINESIPENMILLDFLRSKGYLSVKRGCDTQCCGLCTVLIDGLAVLSCSYLAVRANGKHITTLEGVQDDAEKFTRHMAAEGADQCGFCNPGFIMSVLAMRRELHHFDDSEVRAYLAGNLCRCTGYAGQMRAIKKYYESDE